MPDATPAQLSIPERECLTCLVNSWDIFVRLPESTADDITEFRTAIHAAQKIVALRVARRANADVDVWM